MTDVAPPAPSAPPPSPPPTASPLSDERQFALIIYICYLAAFAFPPLAIVGLVLAYVNRETAPDWLKSHHTFQIYTFWLGFLYFWVSVLLCIVLIGIPLMFATVTWFIVRCALGIDRLMKNQPYPRPESWMT
ncbi:MAG: DUF4870 family protein [Caulobacterales bacterium]